MNVPNPVRPVDCGLELFEGDRAGRATRVLIPFGFLSVCAQHQSEVACDGNGEISAYMDSQLKKHSRDESDPLRNGRFDYLVGPLETLFADTVTEGRLPSKTRRTYQGNICEMNRLPSDVTAGAIVTPDGLWHELNDFGWRMMSGSSQANLDAISQWNIHFRELLSKHPDNWVVAIWAHS